MDANDTRAHSRSLRLGRYSCSGQIYLITTATLGRQPFLASFDSGRLVVEALKTYQDCARTLCFVVMPDHLHWLMELGYWVTGKACLQQLPGSNAIRPEG